MTEKEIILKEVQQKDGEKQVSKRKNPNPFKPNPLYHKKEFIDKLGEYYDIYMSYHTTARRLNEEFGCRITPETVKRIYRKKINETLSSEEKVGKFFENSFIRMQKRYEEAWEMIGDLVYQYKKFRKVMSGRDELTQALTFMKMTSNIISITTEIRKQLEFIRKQQEEIKVYQQNNLIISPIQINQQIKEYFTNMSKKEIKEFFKSLEEDKFKDIVNELKDKGN